MYNRDYYRASNDAVIQKGGTWTLIIGWISAIASLFIYPFIFGPLGVVFGILTAKGRKSSAGLPLIVASIILMGIGLIFSRVILNYTRHFLGI
jgi:hypothetical protein